MHRSEYVYGRTFAEAHSGSVSSEVRTSYFDPRTGKPCKSKPKPLNRGEKATMTAYEKDVALRKAQAEAAAIERGMEQRKAKLRSDRARENRARYMRPVLVDGVRFDSVRAAANHIGTTPEWLGTRLRAGMNTCKGRCIAFAEVVA